MLQVGLGGSTAAADSSAPAEASPDAAAADADAPDLGAAVQEAEQKAVEVLVPANLYLRNAQSGRGTLYLY
jgi:hypothetical protein